MKKFLGKLTKETLTLALAIGAGLVAFIFGKLGVAAVIGVTFYYTSKKGAIDKVIDSIMKSIGAGAGSPPPTERDSSFQNKDSIGAGAGSPPPTNP